MKKTTNKIALVGTGAVGMSFIYSAVNRQIGDEYILIDINEKSAIGNALDIKDAMAVLPNGFKIKHGTYQDCKDADIVVITAGRPQKPGETRIDLIKDNSKIMKAIAESIKKSDFDGITIIASNPCDILTTIYLKVTKYNKHKVMSAGTILDSNRLKRLIGAKLDINPGSVQANIIGEHGDSSAAVYSKATIMGKPIFDYVKEKKITQKDLKQIEQDTINMAYTIIENKGSTYYGIGACLSSLVKAILIDENSTYMVGAYLEGEYNQSGFNISVPAIICKDGWREIIEWDLADDERKKFEKSCKEVKTVFEQAYESIK